MVSGRERAAAATRTDPASQKHRAPKFRSTEVGDVVVS